MLQRSQRSADASPVHPARRPAPDLRQRPHPRQRLGAAARRHDRVEPLAHTATRIPPASSSGTGVSCSGSPPAARPARGRSNSTPQRAAAQHRARRARRRAAARRRPRTRPGRRAATRRRSRAAAARRRRRAPAAPPARGSLMPSSGIHRAGACSGSAAPGRAPEWTIGSSNVPTRGAGSVTPSTSSPARSGACSSSACLIASSSVARDAAHPLQLPCSASRATPSSIAEQLDVAAVGLHVRPDRVERLEHALLERDRVEVVDQQQARDRAVLGELIEDRRSGLARGLDRLDDPAQAVAVHRDHRADQLLGELPGVRVRRARRPARSAAGPGPAARREARLRPCLTSTEPGRRVDHLPHAALAGVHVDAARQARIEAPHRPHDVDRP